MSYKKWAFRTQFRASEDELRAWWARFYENGREAAFWNVIREKRMTITDVASNEAQARYGIMTTAQISQRKSLARFLAILGMQHSQEHGIFDAERLEALAGPLQAAEREIRDGMGIRPSRKSGDWSVRNTIDFIASVLDTWGAVTVESIARKFRRNGEVVRTYSLQLPENHGIWDKITNAPVNYEENLLKL